MDNKRAEILTKLKKFIKKHRIEKAILFGSAARGEIGEDSDIDLILVSKEFKGISVLRRPVPFYLDWDVGYPVDFLCYTPEEFEKLKNQITIVREAVRSGVEIK